MSASRPTSLLDDIEDDDPLLSVVNLIDVFLVIIAALLLAVASSPINPFTAQSVTIIKNEGQPNMEIIIKQLRSEERRVGKECRSRWSPYH